MCGLFFQINERFEYKCQNCKCEESTKTVNCTPKVCPAPLMISCTGPGFVLVNQTNPSDPCCTTYVCRKTCSIICLSEFSECFTFIWILKDGYQLCTLTIVSSPQNVTAILAQWTSTNVQLDISRLSVFLRENAVQNIHVVSTWLHSSNSCKT